MKKKTLLLAVLVLIALLLSGCSNSKAQPFYSSEDGTKQLMFRQKYLFIVEDGQVTITVGRYDDATGQIIINDKGYECTLSEDGKTLEFLGDRYHSKVWTGITGFRIMMECARQFIQEKGVLRWLVSPIFYFSTDIVALFSLGCALLAIVGVLIVIGFIGYIIGKIRR